MRKLMFLSVASLLMFASCSKDDAVPVDNNDGKITFEISTVNQLSDGTTRTPVYSQDATQQVTQVNVYAFMNDGTGNYLYKKTYNIPDWTSGLTFKRYAVADVDKVPAGDYKFLAVGLDAGNLYTITPTTPTTKFDDMLASVTASGNESEAFAGSSQVQVLPNGSRISIEMKRKVAGVLGYFKNVPQTINGTTVKYLRLTASNSNQQVNLTTGTGISTVPAVYRIIDMDISGQTISNGVYTGNDLSSQGVTKLANSQLSGTFMIPVSGITLTLGLYDAGNNALKEWSVSDSSGGSTNFNIIANNFYSLGLKTKVDSTNGGGTPDPSDDDQAIDLLTDQSIVLTITPTWDVLHNLIIQNQVPN